MAEGALSAKDAAFPFVPGPLLNDARNACAEAVARYLLSATYRMWGDEDINRRYELKEVFPVWPDPSKDLPYPCASIIEAGPSDHAAHSLTPTMLEGSRDVWCKGTVLWKTAELEATFQVDFWLNEDSQREAIAARLPSLFNPSEARAGVILEATERYFRSRVRATLGPEQRIDDANSTYVKERRLRYTVTCETDMVHLREAQPLEIRRGILVIDEGDPPEQT